MPWDGRKRIFGGLVFEHDVPRVTGLAEDGDHPPEGKSGVREIRGKSGVSSSFLGKSGVSSSFLPEKTNRHRIMRKVELTPDYAPAATLVLRRTVTCGRTRRCPPRERLLEEARASRRDGRRARFQQTRSNATTHVEARSGRANTRQRYLEKSIGIRVTNGASLR